MSPRRAAEPRQAPHNGVTADVAGRLYEALGPVQQELKRRHIPCLRVTLISLELWERQPLTFPEYHMPAIEVWDRQGKIVAAVTVSVDLSHFCVAIPSQQSHPYLVPAETPELVAALIPGYDRETS
ncbi:hypothetical protein [Nonomuraea sp. NEAU-A123]|uniref:hypothetical protein n=1 Tax=Nonomuraea sp. NEAU-A123 TaxID=2839649 RepID=UPI001BE485B7|nr:hypothetical protein [Nonomuraea sp. NEAU-A123]MBT2232599.1 hypothetical protein [Nonomuraea sp. NEAU-A123]